MELSKLMAIAAKVDQLDYYQLLGTTKDASSVDIRRAYHKRARSIHPDRFFSLPDPEILSSIDRIFKRIAEAYTILRDEGKRNFYDQGLLETPRKLRFNAEDQQALRQKEKAKEGRTPQGRQFYEKAHRMYKRKEIKQAVQALQMAVTFEADNTHFQELLSQWQEEL